MLSIIKVCTQILHMPQKGQLAEQGVKLDFIVVDKEK